MEELPHLHRRFLLGVFLSLGLMVVAEIWLRGTGEDGLRLVLRSTARTSAVLFAVGFAAPALRALRRFDDSLLLAFLASQFIHLVGVISLAGVRNRPAMLADPPGIVAYTFVAIIALRLGLERYGSVPQWLRRAESVSLYGFWAIITGAFAHFFPGIRRIPLHYLLISLLVAALLVRVYGSLKGTQHWESDPRFASPRC
jgi:cytochrome bd-type quinol oxidase subunit 2